MTTESKSDRIGNIELGTGKFVNITFTINAEQNALAINAVARLITHNLMTRPFYGVNSIGFYWVERSNEKIGEKPKQYSQEVNEILQEISQDYDCQITFS